MPRPTIAATVRAVLLLTAVLVAATLTRQTSLARPDLVLPVVVAAGLWSGPSRGAVTGLAAGWLVDVVPPGSAVLGTTALVYAGCGLLAGAGRREGRIPGGWLLLVAAVTTLVAALGQLVIGLGEAVPVRAVGAAESALATWLLTVLVVPLLVAVQRHLVARRPA